MFGYVTLAICQLLESVVTVTYFLVLFIIITITI